MHIICLFLPIFDKQATQKVKMLLLTCHFTCGQWKLSPADGFGSLVGHKFVMLSFLPLVFRPQIIIIIIIFVSPMDGTDTLKSFNNINIHLPSIPTGMRAQIK